MTETFNELNLESSLIKALEIQGISVPTEVQVKSIPLIKENRDIIAQSETGTGKTLAYLLPLFEKLDAHKREMQALILVPTHELAIQVLRQIESLSQNSDIRASSTPVIGNVNITRQIDKLKEKPNIIVGSPGRILELIKMKKISAHTVKTIILDEADRLMDDNNLDIVKSVIKTTLKERQLELFSASISQKTINRAKELMKEPVIIKGEANLTVPDTIEHIYFMAEKRDRFEILKKLIRMFEPKSAVVFVSKNRDLEIVTEKLKYHGFSAEGIHGSHIKLDRKKTMDDFKSGKIQLLVASDIAARGIDVQGITHIFNFDLPEQPIEYLHRAGRTGRNGNKGIVISISTERELMFIKNFEKVLKIKLTLKAMSEGKIKDNSKNCGITNNKKGIKPKRLP